MRLKRHRSVYRTDDVQVAKVHAVLCIGWGGKGPRKEDRGATCAAVNRFTEVPFQVVFSLNTLAVIQVATCCAPETAGFVTDSQAVPFM